MFKTIYNGNTLSFSSEQVKSYLIDCKGYSEADLDGSDYSDFLEGEDYMALEDWCN